MADQNTIRLPNAVNKRLQDTLERYGAWVILAFVAAKHPEVVRAYCGDDAGTAPPPTPTSSSPTTSETPGLRKRRPMNATERAAVSRRMKRYWAARRRTRRAKSTR